MVLPLEAMKFRRITSEGLSHHSYFFADEGEAVVVDPRRDLDVYFDAARESGARIKWVLETHRNEDFVAGAAGLAELSGATVLHGEGLKWGYGTTVEDGHEFGIGKLRVRALKTPGHTDESMSYAVADTRAASDAVLVFTGDALFVGDVGRTDLYGPDETERLARTLYRSIHDKMLPLGDGVILCAAHGGGSVCGGKILDRDLSTLGFERIHNEALRGRDCEAFVARKKSEKMVRPPYFRRMEVWNQKGSAPLLQRVAPLSPLSLSEFDAQVKAGAVLIDARMPQAFAGGHIAGALNVWLEGLSAYLPWAAPVDARIALVLPEGVDLDRVARVLLRIGYDDVVGYLRGGFEIWQNRGRPLVRGGTIETEMLRRRLAAGKDELVVVDVRKPDEWEEGSIEGATKIFVGDLEQRIKELPRDRELVAMCSVGHRGGLAASILERHGLRAVNYLGGYTAWKTTADKADT